MLPITISFHSSAFPPWPRAPTGLALIAQAPTGVSRSRWDAQFAELPESWPGVTLFSSTGQRNTLVEHFCWGREVQRLSRPLVWLMSGPVQACFASKADSAAPLGEYWRSRRFVFSFVPRCPGLCGLQKYSFTSIAIENP